MRSPRYPSYRQTKVDWLGAVPAHWAVAPLGYRYEVALGKMLDEKQITGKHLAPYLRNVDVQWGQINTTGLPRMDFSGHDLIRYSLRLGDLLVCEGGEVGRAAIWRGELSECYYQKALHRLRPRKATRDLVDFLYYQLRCAAEHGIFSGGEGKSTISHLTAESFRHYHFAFPPREEQASIVAFLGRETKRVDALIEEQERLMSLLLEKGQAVISHAVTKGLDPDAPMKASGIAWQGNFPAHWRLLKIGRVSAFLTSGPRGWSERIAEDGPIFVQSADLDDKLHIDFGGARRVRTTADAEALRTRIANGDVLVCITGAKTGNVAVCGGLVEDAYINQHLCLIRPTPDLDPWYLGAYLKSSAGQTYFDLAQYGLKQGLSLTNVREAPVLVPPLQEQVEIREYVQRLVSSLDELGVEARRAIGLLLERRRALISAAVTGQINVCEVASMEVA
jgi:type I restriction enzyme, S subunit